MSPSPPNEPCRGGTQAIAAQSLLAALDGSVMIAATDPAGAITQVNRAFCETSGYTRAELIGGNHSALNSRHHPREFWAQMWKVIARGGVWRAEVCNRNKKGALYWVDVTVGPVRDENGTLSGYISAGVDITVRKRAAVAAAENETKFRTLFECSPVGLALTDYTTGLYIQGNDVLSEITGYSAAELGERSFKSITAPRYAEIEAAQREHLRTHGAYGPYELEVVRKDGTRVPVAVHGSLIIGGDGRRMVWSIVQDITRQKSVEAELARARDVAQAASRAKDEFLANMSHEIRTPMTAILGYAELLRDEHDFSARRAQIIDTIGTAGRHLLGIINDVLDLSKIEAGRLAIEPLASSPARLLAEVEGLARPAATAKGLTLSLQAAPTLPPLILTDPTRLRQILLNLVGNAVKFTAAGGVTLAARAENGRLIVDVADTGPGLSPVQAELLFKPFSQVDSALTRQHGGAGLGLAICRRLARLMDGDVTLTSTAPGCGSCFRLDLPLITAHPGEPRGEAASSTKPPRAPAGAPPRLLRGRILLAEDGLDNQRLLSLHLRKAGAHVDIAANGRIALQMLEQAAACAEPYDLLLSDMQMPEMDGYTLAATLRTRPEPQRSIPIVALTAHAMADDRSKCLQAGCDDYATKPIDKCTLLEICAAWIGRPGGRPHVNSVV
jgi:PAS domain S-box-containing protein